MIPCGRKAVIVVFAEGHPPATLCDRCCNLEQVRAMGMKTRKATAKEMCGMSKTAKTASFEFGKMLAQKMDPAEAWQKYLDILKEDP